MNDKDTKLIWEARWGHGRPRAGAKRQTSAEMEEEKSCKPGYFWCPEDKVCKKEVEEATLQPGQEETYEERGQRREGKGLLEALLPWIETARGEQLNDVYQSILTAYQAAGYPETGGDERVERDDDYRGEDLSPRETDQDRYGYPGDR